MSKKNNSGMWQYLDAVGVLEKGTDEEIKAAKKAYWKKYFLEYKKKQRTKKPEFNVCFSKENGDYDTIVIASEKHQMAPTAFVRLAALSYLKRTYIVPDKWQIARLEQLLMECLNEVKAIVARRDKYFWQNHDKLDLIEKRIQKLEEHINELFRNPPLIHDHQNQIA